jgi:hypothetical protein
MARHGGERGEDERMDDAFGAQAPDHSRAHVGRVEAEAGRRRAPAGVGMGGGDMTLRPDQRRPGSAACGRHLRGW